MSSHGNPSGKEIPTANRPVVDSKDQKDQDVHKGAVENDRPDPKSGGHPGLDDKGLPNDPVAIGQDAEGARDDESQG
jgi:hypothetical protein